MDANASDNARLVFEGWLTKLDVRRGGSRVLSGRGWNFFNASRILRGPMLNDVSLLDNRGRFENIRLCHVDDFRVFDKVSAVERWL